MRCISKCTPANCRTDLVWYRLCGNMCVYLFQGWPKTLLISAPSHRHCSSSLTEHPPRISSTPVWIFRRHLRPLLCDRASHRRRAHRPSNLSFFRRPFALMNWDRSPGAGVSLSTSPSVVSPSPRCSSFSRPRLCSDQTPRSAQ
jgi:hypothetical protein